MRLLGVVEILALASFLMLGLTASARWVGEKIAPDAHAPRQIILGIIVIELASLAPLVGWIVVPLAATLLGYGAVRLWRWCGEEIRDWRLALRYAICEMRFAESKTEIKNPKSEIRNQKYPRRSYGYRYRRYYGGVCNARGGGSGISRFIVDVVTAVRARRGKFFSSAQLRCLEWGYRLRC
ncbi:MAG: hypothetical protein DCC52_19560 [Chloroflexi bacterium]|nr:MAG: hypothetical protein DCC52_19560 [Chloroflexota bacterium]